MSELQAHVVFISVLVLWLTVESLRGVYTRGVYANGGFFRMRNLGVVLLGVASMLSSRALLAVLVGSGLAWAFPLGLRWIDDINVLWIFIGYVLVQDYLHYWLHRLGHTSHWLWNLHKVHHTPQRMDVTITFRVPFFFYCLFPSFWLGAAMTWAGLPEIVLIASTVNVVLSMSVHTSFRWDDYLYRHALTRPFMWLLARIIPTPDTHHYHHNLEGGYKNYGVMFILWDILHGTAAFPRRQVEGFGLFNPEDEDPWYAQVLWPLLTRDSFRRKRSDAVIAD